MNITIKTFQSGGKTIAIDPPLRLDIKQDQDGVYSVWHPRFDIGEMSLTVYELRDAVLEHLDMAWREYAKEADDNLTPKALELKQQLLRRMKETTDDD